MTVISDVYVIEVDDKPIFATSLFVHFENKKEELDTPYKVQFYRMDKFEHSALLKECTKNIINMHRKGKSMRMTDKS